MHTLARAPRRCDAQLATQHDTSKCDKPQILKIAADITTGLAYLHPSVVHRDLKVCVCVEEPSATADALLVGTPTLNSADAL
jgi:serine/threonine protein kinase